MNRETGMKNRWNSKLNFGLIALGVFFVLCVLFVIFSSNYVKNMPDKMIALAGDYYETLDADAGIPHREYLKAEIYRWDDLTHAVVRVLGNLTDREPDLPVSECTGYDLYDQFYVELSGGKWHVKSVSYSFQGRREAFDELYGSDYFS
ncbi:MAG: hypothetical protein IJS71_05725 [Clostridia bacterium]|nr:hypothetical protein [Clostridia bacterium]